MKLWSRTPAVVTPLPAPRIARTQTYRCPSPGCEYVLEATPSGERAGAFAIVVGPRGATYAQCPLDGSVLA